MVEIERVLDGETLRRPHFFELDDRTFLTDGDDLRLFAEVGRVVLEKADPKVGQRLLGKTLKQI